MIDYIILAFILAVLAFAVYRLIRRRQKGESRCVGCSGCAHAVSCPSSGKAPR